LIFLLKPHTSKEELACQ